MSCLNLGGWGALVALVVAAIAAVTGWIRSHRQGAELEADNARLRGRLDAQARDAELREAAAARRRALASRLAIQGGDRAILADERREPPTAAAAAREAAEEARAADAMADAFDERARPCPTCGKYGNPFCSDAYHIGRPDP